MNKVHIWLQTVYVYSCMMYDHLTKSKIKRIILPFEKSNRETLTVILIFTIDFRACYTLKSKKSKGLDEGIKLLKEALEIVEKRNNANIEESTILACFSSIDIFESHTNDGATNLFIQNQNRTEILQAIKNQCTTLIEKLENFKKDGAEITVDQMNIMDLFKDKKGPIMSKEIVRFINEGNVSAFDVTMKPKFSWDAFFVTLIGIGQVIGGGLLCVFSAGALSSLGMNLIIEGIQDGIEGIKGMVTGSFNWTAWAIGKAISILISVVSFGLTKGISWMKNGAKFSGFKETGKTFLKSFTKVGWKESAKHAMKYTAKTIVEQVAVELVGKAFDEVLEKSLKATLGLFKKEIENFLRK